MIVLDDRQKNFGTEVVAIGRRQPNTSRPGRVVHHMNDQPMNRSTKSSHALGLRWRQRSSRLRSISESATPTSS